MREPVLALDLGNSRLKAALFLDGDGAALFQEDVPADAAALPGWWERCVPPLLAGHPAPARVVLASVAGEVRGAALARHLEQTLRVPVARNPDCGLELAVRHVETLGHDRRYAARGALARLGPEAPGALVVDAGTALTVDALRRGPEGRGVFLGGAIAPGPRLLADALAAGGAQLPAFDPHPDAPALGRETVEALDAGVSVGLAGAARELVLRVASEAELEGSPVLLTGGAAAFVRAVLRRLVDEGGVASLDEDPLLVLRGLVLARPGGTA